MKLKSNEILVLRSNAADMTSHNGFTWPRRGPVEAPDWQDTNKCGRGLHGLPWGVGGNYCNIAADAVWLVVRVSTVKGGYRHGRGDMCDKCKFRKGIVVYAGTRDKAVAMIQAHCPVGETPRWSTATACDDGTATAGDDGTATAGARGTATAGARGTATAGARGTATAGYGGTATAGDDGILNIRWWDGRRYRIATFYVGETGILPNVAYKCDNNGEART